MSSAAANKRRKEPKSTKKQKISAVALGGGGIAAGAFAAAMTAAVLINDKRARSRAIAKLLSLRARANLPSLSASLSASLSSLSLPSVAERGQAFFSAHASEIVDQGQEFFSARSQPPSLSEAVQLARASLRGASLKASPRASLKASPLAEEEESSAAVSVLPLIIITNDFAPLYSLVINFYVTQATGMIEKIDFWYANGDRPVSSYPWKFWLGAHRSHVVAKASFEMELAQWTSWWRAPLPYIRKQGLRTIQTQHDAMPLDVPNRDDIMEVDIQIDLDRVVLPFIGELDPARPFKCRLQTIERPFDRRTGGTFRLTLPSTWTVSPPAETSSMDIDVRISRKPSGQWMASHDGTDFDTLHFGFESSNVPMTSWKVPTAIESVEFVTAADQPIKRK